MSCVVGVCDFRSAKAVFQHITGQRDRVQSDLAARLVLVSHDGGSAITPTVLG